MRLKSSIKPLSVISASQGGRGEPYLVRHLDWEGKRLHPEPGQWEKALLSGLLYLLKWITTSVNIFKGSIGCCLSLFRSLLWIQKFNFPWRLWYPQQLGPRHQKLLISSHKAASCSGPGFRVWSSHLCELESRRQPLKECFTHLVTPSNLSIYAHEQFGGVLSSFYGSPTDVITPRMLVLCGGAAQ